MVGATSTPITARAALTTARLPDLSQQTAPAFVTALPASILGEAPQGSSLDALASMASFSAEHHRANVARGLPPAMANTPTLMDVPSTGPCRMIGDQGGPWVHQDNTGLPPQALDMSLQAATASKPCTDLASDVDRQASMLKARATRDEIDRQVSVLSLEATVARALCAEVDPLDSEATKARALCAEVDRLDSVLSLKVTQARVLLSLQATKARALCDEIDRQASMLSLRATKAHATRDEIDRQASVLSLKATQARALCAEIDRQASVLSLKATQARALCAEIHRRASVLEQL